jgi:hypothetical protein
VPRIGHILTFRRSAGDPFKPTALVLTASPSRMEFRSGSLTHGWVGCCLLLLLLAFLAACTISPRRIVGNNPSPTPTPGISPTPTPSVTPTATPTPTPMAAAVPSEFLFTSDPSAGLILGFKINSDGGLSPVPGSPFEVADSPRLVAAIGNHLVVAGQSTLAAFAVDRETETISQSDVLAVPPISNLVTEQPSSATAIATTAKGQLVIRILNNKIQITRASERSMIGSSADAAVGRSRNEEAMDASGKLLYVLNTRDGTVSAFQVRDGKVTPLSPSSYPAGHGASSLAITAP